MALQVCIQIFGNTKGCFMTTKSVIIYTHCPTEKMREYIANNVGQIKYELPFINAFAVEANPTAARKMTTHSMIKLVDDDAKVSKLDFFKTGDPREYTYNPPDQRSIAHSSRSVRNSIGVAVLDTGISLHHDLTKPYNKIIAFKDFVGGKLEPYDEDGHGTHIAGIIAGNGYACIHSREAHGSVVMGVAPMSNIVAVKVLDDNGNGNVSDILAGLQWVIDNKDGYNIKVINISLGMTVDKKSTSDPLARGAAAAAAQGMTVVAAAGNSGPEYGTVNSPGISPSVITVGAADTRHATSASEAKVAKFSSRGPTLAGAIKPDLVAPGVEIYSLSCKSPSSYKAESGTSMATPMVSGAAALLYEKNPELAPVEVKKILTHSAVRLRGEEKYAQGAGMLNIERALNML